MIWELTFLADKDMRPAVFDFATTNGLKPFNSIKKNKIEAVLEKLLRSSL
jgi:ABC-2 type transport system ATP-binding protein